MRCHWSVFSAQPHTRILIADDAATEIFDFVPGEVLLEVTDSTGLSGTDTLKNETEPDAFSRLLKAG